MIDITIPAVKKPNQFGEGDIFILQPVEKDVTINLKDWFIQFLPPEREGDQWCLVLQPRYNPGTRKDENTSGGRPVPLRKRQG